MAYVSNRAARLRPVQFLLTLVVGLSLAFGISLSAMAAPAPPVQTAVSSVGAGASAGVVTVQPTPASVQLAETGVSKYKYTRYHRVKWSVRVVNRGGQRAINACRGGLTRWGTVYGKRYYAVHNYCGGAPILHLKKGNVIKISGKKYVVVSTRVVRKGATIRAVRGMKGSALLQTCYFHSRYMRVVGVKRL